MNEIHLKYKIIYPLYITAKKIFHEFKQPEETLSEIKRAQGILIHFYNYPIHKFDCSKQKLKDMELFY